MRVGVTRAEPAAGPAAFGAAGAALRPARPHLRLTLLALGGALVLAALVLIACELAAARVPQHRAALEELIRHETGLEVSFSELSVRWGWYGPEAVFHSVVLGEPAGAGARLSAPRLIVGLDVWRMLRSGRLEAGRITLESPDIDLGSGGAAVAGPQALPEAAARAEVLSAGARLLWRWRGGRIDIEGGTLRGALSRGAAAVALNIRYAQLRRLGAEWSADALVLLPERLGASARLGLQMSGDPALPQGSSGTLTLVGRRLEFAGWRALTSYAQALRYLPQAGRGNLELHVAFAHGQVLRADGTIHAEALEWAAASAAAAPLALERLRGAWQLAQRDGEWQLTVDALELGAPAAAAATISVAAAADGAYAHGRIQHAPIPALVAIAHWYAPQLPLSEVALGGQARELTFDWNAQRPAGARLITAADLQDLTLTVPGYGVLLSGLSAHVSGADGRLLTDLQAHGAHLTLTREQPFVLDALEIAARLAVDTTGVGWRLSSDDLEVRRESLSLAASGEIGAAAAAAAPRMRAHLAVKDADVVLLAGLLGPRALAAFGGAATHVTAGRITSADVAWRGPLVGGQAPWNVPGADFTGAVALRDASLSGDELWPETRGLDARVDWRGPHVHAAIAGARSGTFQLASARADWDARGVHPLRLAAHLAGSAQDALAWLRAHPQLAGWARGAQDLDLRGATLLDLDLALPSAARPARGGARVPRVRIAATLDGVQLRPLAGLPPVEALRGTLTFAGGHLQRSTLTGHWLGGPVSLGVGEQPEHRPAALAISGRGLIEARQALQAAGADAQDAQLSGNAEWSALLTYLPAADPQRVRWQLRADSSLIGVTSHLPEPFAKAAGAGLPLHLELQGGSDDGQLQVNVGERLRAQALLTRSGDGWRIERGAVRMGSGAPALPAEPVVLLDGRLSRLDLAACLALWRQVSQDAALPELRARLSAAQLLAGPRSYADASLAARVTRGGGVLQLQAADVSGTARWPAVIDSEHPAAVHLASFSMAQPGDAALAAALAAVLAPATELAIDDLQWQGRSVGAFGATLASRGENLDVSGLHLSGPGGDTRASAQCTPGACRARFSLDSADAAATLAAFGLRPDLSAGHARLEGELQWSPQVAAPLATLGGHLHMRLEEGLVHAAPEGGGVPFALLSVPELIAGIAPEAGDAAQPGLRFAQLAGNFELRDGQATTADLHFDGDAEILVRGRVGLAERDYDEQAWILRGEERLPAAVRRLGPTPKVAAVWLSLREVFAGAGADRSRTALRLRGTWNDPIVTPAE
jgi:uncharacterized protein YhdP